MNVNKVLVVGRIGQDVKMSNTQGGQAVCNLSVATTRRWTNQQNNQPQEKTEWHRIVVWGKQAENCGKYLQKGQEVAIDGRLETRSWEDKQNVKHYTTEIVANEVQFGAKPLGQQAQAPQQQGYQQPQPQQNYQQPPVQQQYAQNAPPAQNYAPNPGTAPAGQAPQPNGQQGTAPHNAPPAGNAANQPPQQYPQNNQPPAGPSAQPNPGGQEQPQFVGNDDIPF